MTTEQFFWRNVTVSDGCWLWDGNVHYQNGYGRFRYRGAQRPAHHYLWEQINGEVPNGQVLHHNCEMPLCVRPDHVEPLTRAGHLRLHRPAEKVYDWYRGRIHCKHGHEWTPENTYYRKDGARSCRACRREDYHRGKRRKVALFEKETA